MHRIAATLALGALLACGQPMIAGPTPAPASEPGKAIATEAGKAIGRKCSAPWLRFPKPGELTYVLDPWTVFLIADNGHDPETLAYASTWASIEPLPGPPEVWVGPGPQAQGPVVMVRVGSWGKHITVNVRASAGRDCSAQAVSFPSGHRR